MNAEMGVPEQDGARAAVQTSLLRFGFDALDGFLAEREGLETALDNLVEIGDETASKLAVKLRAQLDALEPSVTMIGQVKADHPDVLFLSEAFTRPARLYGLAKLGFTQSYTYFTWRTAKWELEEFGRQLAEHADYARPNLFVNTPDILHESLQHGGPGMFALRAVLAATMGPSWGVYSGYELFEHVPVRPGSEEYLDSEKYELRPRDFAGALDRAHSLEPFLARLNEIRRSHPALCQLRTIRFHHVDNDALLAYSKFDPATGDTVLVVVNLNPFGAESGTLGLDMGALGMEPYERFWVRDEITGEEYEWGQSNFVRLDPVRAVAHVLNMPQVSEQQRPWLLRRE